MRTIGIVFILAAFASNLHSQENIFPIDSINGKITYSEIIQVDSVNSQELYVRAHAWFAHTFISAQNVIQLDDKEAGRIIGKGTFAVADNVENPGLMNVHVSGTVDFTIEIQTKDGRYKYIFTNLSFKLLGMQERDLRSEILSTSGTYKNKMNLRWLELRENTDKTVLNIISSLKQAMTTNDDDEW
jgi:hypothetical protein